MTLPYGDDEALHNPRDGCQVPKMKFWTEHLALRNIVDAQLARYDLITGFKICIEALLEDCTT